MSGFEVIEHTADVGIHAWGDSIEEAFEEAAMGMFSLIADTDKCEEKGEISIILEADDYDSLLVDWLSELLYAFDAERLFLCRFNVEIEGENRLKLRGSACGELYDPEKHGMRTEIKAVTYHMLEIKPDKGDLKVLFDI